jgi:GAF domain-containing protein
MEATAEGIRGAVLDALAAALRQAFAVQRCTIRLDVDGDFFPVVHESLVAPAHSLIDERRIELRGQPVIEAMLAGADQVVQPDTRAASDDPEFRRMLEIYDGMGAQIVTPARIDGRIAGVISLHHLGGPREWTARETELARAAAALLARILDDDDDDGRAASR